MFSQILKEIAVANHADTWESNIFWQKEHQMQRLWGENGSAMFKDPKEDSMAEKQLDGGKKFD